MNKKLDLFETQLREIFEEKLIQLVPGNHTRRKLYDDLLDSMENNLEFSSSGEILAPDEYIIFAPQSDLTDWKAHQDVLDETAELLYNSGLSKGYYFNQKPTITTQAKDVGNEPEILVLAQFSKKEEKLPDTAAITQEEIIKQPQGIIDRAFLIVGGRKNFPLNKAVINIGRHSDNDLILEDPHISRHHAQIRAVNNRFVIFDVGSTGGIFINEKKATQTSLQTGDVIRIGMVNLIYVQETTSEQPTTAFSVDDDLTNLDPEN